eukprot:FR736367.1.p2 GENE.FR736367.1~~FR736367.1.p2  ORF type:complete len:100 (+),score=10.05 FR736367.1:210-509(+)
MLPVLCAYAQRKLPYSLERVESNDVLYGGSKAYIDELNSHRSTVMQEIISQLTALRESSVRSVKIRQTELVLKLVNKLFGQLQTTRCCDELCCQAHGAR